MSENDDTTDTEAQDDEPAVRPNRKYDAVFGTSYTLSDDRFREKHERRHEQERTVREDVFGEGESYPSDSEETGLEDDPYLTEEERHEPLTWDDFSLTDHPQLLRGVAEYFEGVDPSQDPETIQERLRTGWPEWYANAYCVVKELLDVDDAPGDEDDEEEDEEPATDDEDDAEGS